MSERKLHKPLLRSLIAAAAVLSIVSCSNQNPPASLVIHNGNLYTANPQQTFEQAIAIKDDRIVFIGTDAAVKDFIGPKTEVINAKGNMILPGLHDAHIHPFGLVASANCDLESQALTLAELSVVIENCVSTLALNDGDWLAVEQWNFTKGNQPDATRLNIRMALDEASATNPIFLRGNDGHHGAANSIALESAKNTSGKVVGISRNTINSDFGEYVQYIGVDNNGEPDGQLSEGARYLLGLPGNALTGDGTTAELSAKLPQVSHILAKAGITSIQDAAADIETISIFEKFSTSGQQTFRYTGALFSDFEKFSRPLQKNSTWKKQNSLKEVNIDAVVNAFSEIRARQSNPDLFKTTAAKIFIDGVIEGNPYSNPPALPNAAVYKAYKQPIYSINEESITLAGYVDLESAVCEQTRVHPVTQKSDRAHFFTKHGYYPEQCISNNGRLEHDEAFIHAYITSLEAAGFSVHAHAIGDRAVGVALDAFFQSKPKLGSNLTQTISHAQQISDADLKRFVDSGIYLAFTFAWAIPDYEYDITVTPFIDKLASLEHLYDPNNYAMSNHYPANTAKTNGAVIVAGSDAPVDTRDPRPFINMAAAITRSAEGGIYNEKERLKLVDALDAFTINSAKSMRQDHITGSLEVGKKADVIVLDRNLVQLAHNFDASAIAKTKVDLTIFDGKIVYR